MNEGDLCVYHARSQCLIPAVMVASSEAQVWSIGYDDADIGVKLPFFSPRYPLPTRQQVLNQSAHVFANQRPQSLTLNGSLYSLTSDWQSGTLLQVSSAVRLNQSWFAPPRLNDTAWFNSRSSNPLFFFNYTLQADGTLAFTNGTYSLLPFANYSLTRFVDGSLYLLDS